MQVLKRLQLFERVLPPEAANEGIGGKLGSQARHQRRAGASKAMLGDINAGCCSVMLDPKDMVDRASWLSHPSVIIFSRTRAHAVVARGLMSKTLGVFPREIDMFSADFGDLIW